MASNTKKVTLDVAVKTQEQQIDALEKKLDETQKKANELKRQKIEMKVNADTQALNDVTQKLNQAESKLNQMKSNKLFFATDTDAPQKLQQAQAEVNKLKQQQIDLQVQVESYKLDELQSKKDAIEADEINVQLNNQSAMQGIEQIADGFSRIKSAASEVGQQFGAVLESAGKYETNFKFLEHAIGNAETARQKMSEIDSIVRQLPGDDTALGGLLSSAVAKDSSLTADNLRSMATSAADYMSAMDYYGKSATEAQQDLTNYILSGNTAELERSPILQGHIDKLKEATTVQERSKALAEALNEEHWGGMSTQDTYNNKLQEFNAMLETGKRNLGLMFQEGAKGGMDFLLNLNEATGGIVGMGIAMAQFASPVTDALIGLSQIATGINAIKETKIAEWASTAKDKLSSIGSAIRNIDYSGKFNGIVNGLKNIGSTAGSAASKLGSSLVNNLRTVGNAAKTAAVSIGKFTINLIKSGVEAVIAAGKWLIAKGVLIAQRTATMLAAGAQAFLNLVMSMNPIILVITAIIALIAILGYLYFTNEDVRNAINGLGQALWGLGGTIYGYLVGAFEYLQGAWQNTVDWFNNGAQTISDTVTGAFTWLAESATGSLEWLSGAWQNTVNWFTSGAQWISDSVTSAFTWITDTITGFITFITTSIMLIIQTFMNMAMGVLNAVNSAITYISMLPGMIGAYLQSVISRVVSFVSSLVSNFLNGARNSVNNFMNQIRSLPGQFKAELQRMLSAVNEWAATLPAKFWEAGVNAVKNFLNALGIHSPGFMAVNFSEEIKRLEDSATYNAIADRISGTAKDIVHAWGSPELEYQVNQLLDKESQNTKNDNNSLIELLRIIIGILRNLPKPEGGSFTFNHYGDTDSEERMERILEAVRRDFYWNNEKAGRNVEELYGV